MNNKIKTVLNEFIFSQKYRPQTLEDCILTPEYTKLFQNMIDNKEIQNIILDGEKGIGKTTIAIMLCKVLNLEYILINGSLDRNIDTVRTDITRFITSASFSNNIKVVIIDEAEYMNLQSTQPALRSFIEKYSKVARFILTCNNSDIIIDPIKSRCTLIQFNYSIEDKKYLMLQFRRKLITILNIENIKYNDVTLNKIITKFNPDMRGILNNIQLNISDGELNDNTVNNVLENSLTELKDLLKCENNYNELRLWVGNNTDITFYKILNWLYENDKGVFKFENYGNVILIYRNYDINYNLSSNKDIYILAFLLELQRLNN